MEENIEKRVRKASIVLYCCSKAIGRRLLTQSGVMTLETVDRALMFFEIVN